MTLSKIDFFDQLDELTKQEIIYSMEQVTHAEGTKICKKDEVADRMFVIKSGVVSIVTTFDNRLEEKFIVEKLCRGAIVNHNAFLVNDEADTDFICESTVICYELSLKKIETIAAQRKELQSAINKLKYEVYSMGIPIALDYVLHTKRCKTVEEWNKEI